MNQKLNLLLNISKLIWFKEITVHWFIDALSNSFADKNHFKEKLYYISSKADYTLSHTLTDHPPPVSDSSVVCGSYAHLAHPHLIF